MLRKVITNGTSVPDRVFREFVRYKTVRSASILKKSERLKLWHKENKELFGPLLETSKQKRLRLAKSAKNNSSADKNNTAVTRDVGSDSVKYGSDLQNVIPGHSVYPISVVQALKKTMWLNTRSCVNFISALSQQKLIYRGIRTPAFHGAAKSSAVQAGYDSEDKILQIKQHQNDYAQQYPSVTLILNKTMTEESQQALEKWKQERIAEMGLEEFNRYYEAQMAVGTKFHSTLKTYFTQPQSQLRIEKEVEGVWNSVGEVLRGITSPKAIESNVIHPVLKYRGIFDAIADYEDKPTLIEWKKSDKPRKSLALTYDNPVQLAAYFGAVCHDLNYKHFNVRDALLVIAYTDGSKADVYHLTTDKLREHWAQWLIRLEAFMQKHGTDSEKILKGGKRLFEEDIANLE
ncbi:Mitochondrial genome maintenance exonuclease 1 [Eumeta japonica]|uniref:Mitochondrial genome maintenance exonuclease 1 n=1 Tax=Eumeta variegata TaxID=151549 RepID=A0A4C1WWK4_EUMVA|nr:Mitochondrial genome maintenance exonuclease 1 [Eumeta japonica]